MEHILGSLRFRVWTYTTVERLKDTGWGSKAHKPVRSTSYARSWLAEWVAIDRSELGQWGVLNREVQTLQQLLWASRQQKWVLSNLQPPTEGGGRT